MNKDKKKIQLNFTDGDGKRYIFFKDNFEAHLKKHPELSREDFTERIKRAIISPTIIYPAYKARNRYCYYYEEYTASGVTRYTKVVVQKTRTCYFIITAFRPTSIKEATYFREPLCHRP